MIFIRLQLIKNFYSNFLAGECFYPGEIIFNIIEIMLPYMKYATNNLQEILNDEKGAICIYCLN